MLCVCTSQCLIQKEMKYTQAVIKVQPSKSLDGIKGGSHQMAAIKFIIITIFLWPPSLISEHSMPRIYKVPPTALAIYIMGKGLPLVNQIFCMHECARCFSVHAVQY